MFKKVLSIILSAILVFSVATVSSSAKSYKKLDLAFVVDTTGSMGSSISQVKSDIKTILASLDNEKLDYRIALVDYRDFPIATGTSYDYAYKVQMDFTSDKDRIINAVNNLSLGDGGDRNETICSALIDGLGNLSWNTKSGNVAILIGDCPALDPERYTGYTKDMAIDKLNDMSITLFSIVTRSEYEYDFRYLAEGTGGKCYLALDADDITQAILSIIEEDIPVIVDPTETFWQKLVRLIKEFFNAIARFFAAIADLF